MEKENNVFDDRDNLNTFLEEAELQQYYGLFRDILKVNKMSQLKFVATEDLVQIGLSKPEQRRYKKIYSKYFPNTYFTKIKRLWGANKKNEPWRAPRSATKLEKKRTRLRFELNDGVNSHQTPRSSQGPSSLAIEFQPTADNNLKVPTKHIISMEDITINKELGMGQFGVVQQGTWTTGNQRLQVAIKCLGHERMTSNSTEFLKEAAVMHSIEHSNIVRLYGVVLHLDSLMLVTELAPLRSLLECLREVSLRATFSVPTLCEFAEQICDGMTYLENKRLIHRDLAARNILVFTKKRVKISDFGLSRALGVGKDYYQTNYNVNLKLPVAWCAPECILYLRFTSASDVWALGVCLWEMFTYGFQPWAAFSGQQILEAIDAPNFQRLERPECCPEAYYSTMLECWSHDPNKRPKFKDLTIKLRLIRPEQAQATKDFDRPEDCRRNNLLEYKAGQIITVIGKDTSVTKSPMWHGVLPGGACGLFDPDHTKPYVCIEKPITLGSLTPRSSRNSSRSRPSLLRTDRKRHTFTGKQIIHRSMISSPQGDVKHTGHVGLDGAYFGDISFLDPAGCPPRQVVTPYKPSEDLELVPLINPNSPSHLSGATSSLPYPLLTINRPANTDCDEVDVPIMQKRRTDNLLPGLSTDIRYQSHVKEVADKEKTKCPKKHTNKPVSEPTTSKSILNKVKCATLGRSHKVDDGAIPKTDEVHEYHEISDTDTESTTDNARQENTVLPESPGIQKSNADFSQSLLDEMESMFRSLDGRRRDETGGQNVYFEMENEGKSLTLNKAEKKKRFFTGTMKPMSAHDQKTLDTAVAMANEITTKSMNDLAVEKLPNSPSDRSKFHFKFPHVSLHHGSHLENDKEATGKQERRNFTEEANRVSSIQATITEESKLAYISLIEEPTPSSSLISHITKDANGRQLAEAPPIPNVRSLPKPMRFRQRPSSSEADITDNYDEFALPPRATKPKLINKPRHVRKHPLKLPAQLPADVNKPIIYQNAITGPVIVKSEVVEVHKVERKGVDVFDGPSTSKGVTNPFKSSSRGGSANPFVCYYIKETDSDESDGAAEGGRHPGNLVKDCVDHVSVEDLLEFADHKPCGRQRGVESDEVRIMSKVLKEQVTSEECLEALELSDWNVHHAIKLIRIKISVGNDVALKDCCAELAKTCGDVGNTSDVLVSFHPNKVE